MSVMISDALMQSARMTEREMKQEIAVLLFGRDKLTLAQAARFAEMDRTDFQLLIASRGLFVHYDADDFQQDLATLRELGHL
ncbi:MAG: hypothetical protein JWM27_710 [Gemmatimonadetes bacterium]|nr:hypothetical protein [Gemmatimonadota bacterium]